MRNTTFLGRNIIHLGGNASITIRRWGSPFENGLELAGGDFNTGIGVATTGGM